MLGDAGKVEAQPLDLGHHVAGLVDVLGQRSAHVAVVAERVHRGRRDGVHRVAADQLLDVEDVAVGLVLHPGAGPEQALRVGAGGGEFLPALAGHHLLVQHVSHLGVGDGHLAAQRLERLGLLVAGGDPLVDLLVDLRVDAADEKARHAGNAADVLAFREPALEPRDVGLGHRLVGVVGEQQRDVDVDAFADQRADRRHAFRRAGHLHHQVRPVHPFVQAPRLGDRVLLAQREVGRDLEADVAVQSLRALEHRPQHVGHVLDVAHRQRLVDLLRVALAAGRQRLELGVVIVARAHRLLEDRRVGGDAAQPVALHQLLQAAVGDEAAAHEIQPGRLPLVEQLLDRVGLRLRRRGDDGVHGDVS